MEWQPCEVCGGTSTCFHHVFNGANRKYSEVYGLKMRLCGDCHRRMHQDREFWNQYKAIYQQKFESIYGHETYMRIFGRSYL